jgi:hypothetical protein
MSTAKRGGFNPEGNAWFGGGDGALIEMNAKLGHIQEFWPPTPPSPYTYFYEAMPDKNGEVWAAVLYGRDSFGLIRRPGMDRLPDAGTLCFQPENMDRQFHDARNGVVGRLYGSPGTSSAP